MRGLVEPLRSGCVEAFLSVPHEILRPRQASPSDFRRLVLAHLDIAAKVVLREAPMGLVQLAFPDRKVRSVTPDETEFHHVERRLDKIFRVKLTGEPRPTAVHVEVEARWASTVPRATFRRWSLAHQQHSSLLSLVFVLRQGKRQGTPKGVHEVSVLGRHVLTFRFQVIRLWELDGQSVIDKRDPGMLPLVPFMIGGNRKLIDRAQAILETVEPRQRSVDLQVALAVFSGSVFPATQWLDRIDEEVLMESSVYREILSRGEARGKAIGEARGKAIGEARGKAIGEARGKVIGATEGRRTLLAKQIRRRLGKTKKVTALIKALSSCDVATMDEIAFVVLETPKNDLAAKIERLIAKGRQE